MLDFIDLIRKIILTYYPILIPITLGLFTIFVILYYYLTKRDPLIGLMNLLSNFRGFFIALGLIIFLVVGSAIPFLPDTPENQTLIYGGISISLGLFSVGLGFLAYQLSQESDDKMTSIANANFLSLVSKFEKISLITDDPTNLRILFFFLLLNYSDVKKNISVFYIK